MMSIEPMSNPPVEQRLHGELPDPVAPPVPAPRREGEDGGSMQGRREPAPDISMVKRWRYASAVHAARALGSGV